MKQKQFRLSSTLNLHFCPKDNLQDFIKQGFSFMKQQGFDAVDFPMSILENEGANWPKYVEITKRYAQEYDIHPEICHLPYSTAICKNPDLLPAFNEKVHHAIDAAAALGVSYAVLHPNTTTLLMEEYDRTEQYDSVMNHLAPFVEHANKVGVKLAAENMRLVHSHLPVHRYCQNPDELCDITDALGISVCWDFGHAHVSGVKQSDGLSYIGSRLKVLHINDNKAYGDDHLPPFIGTLDWKDAMYGLASTGFDGLFNFEMTTNHLPAEMRELFAQYLVNAARELMKMVCIE